MNTDKSVNESNDQHLYYSTYLSKTEIMYSILSLIVANDVIVIEQMKIQIYILSITVANSLSVIWQYNTWLETV